MDMCEILRRVMGFICLIMMLGGIINAVTSAKGWVLLLSVALSVFVCCCCVLLANRIEEKGGPSDTAPLESIEKEEIFNELAGVWDIVSQNTGQENQESDENIAFSKVNITGTEIIFTGGSHGRAKIKQLFLSRTPTGTLHIDNSGTYIENWDKEQQEIHINNALNKTLIWRRPQTGATVPKAAPASQVAPAVVVLPSWWETIIDNNGKMYYKNNHKMTTSWTPPTAEQIAEETRERSIEAAVEMEGLPPLIYSPPPAFEM